VNGILQDQLEQGIHELGLDIPSATVQRLLQYLELIRKWNRVYNLTAIKDPGQMLSHHILDSLSIIPYIRGTTILDIGSGAGLPGIPLSLVFPERHFCMLDGNAKKTRFIQQAITELDIKNAESIHSRVEDYTASEGFDTVVSRAFSSLSDFVRLALPLMKDSGQLLAMKGRYPTQELEDLPSGIHIEAVHRLEVPLLDSERHLVQMAREELS
jgi:16S rRNA (guanine527-N7)-methyltransferase